MLQVKYYLAFYPPASRNLTLYSPLRGTSTSCCHKKGTKCDWRGQFHWTIHYQLPWKNIKFAGKKNVLPEMLRLTITQTSVQGFQLVGNTTHGRAPAHFFPGSPCFTFMPFLTFTPGSCPTQSQFDSWLQSCPTGDVGGSKTSKWRLLRE